MADRLISADALKREMWRRCGETDIEIDKGRAKWDSGLWIRYKVFEECIKVAPTIEQKHGRWRHYEGTLTCSVCHTEIYDDIMELLGDDVPRYCPNCGADMREVEE